MDTTFIPVTITFFTFIFIAYYLDVLRLSIPIVMIYIIYCFGYFVNSDNNISVDKEKVNEVNEVNRKEIKDNVQKGDFKKSNDNFRGNQKLSKSVRNQNKNPIPIVSSLPKPIVIDSNLVSKNNNKINKVNSKSSIDKELIADSNKENVEIQKSLKLNEIMICRGIYKRNPIKPGVKFINNVDSLFCYTKISNSGAKQEVKHIWYHEDKEMTTVSYNIKTSYNYRSWSKKTIYPRQTGKWRVDVVNKFGDILGSRDFIINSINTNY